MTITELVLSNAGGEIGRVEIATPAAHNDDCFDVFDNAKSNSEVRAMLEMLSVGDTITIEERWTERD